jgi:hypothetical protein
VCGAALHDRHVHTNLACMAVPLPSPAPCFTDTAAPLAPTPGHKQGNHTTTVHSLKPMDPLPLRNQVQSKKETMTWKAATDDGETPAVKFIFSFLTMASSLSSAATAAGLTSDYRQSLASRLILLPLPPHRAAREQVHRCTPEPLLLNPSPSFPLL